MDYYYNGMFYAIAGTAIFAGGGLLATYGWNMYSLGLQRRNPMAKEHSSLSLRPPADSAIPGNKFVYRISHIVFRMSYGFRNK